MSTSLMILLPMFLLPVFASGASVSHPRPVRETIGRLEPLLAALNLGVSPVPFEISVVQDSSMPGGLSISAHFARAGDLLKYEVAYFYFHEASGTELPQLLEDSYRVVSPPPSGAHSVLVPSVSPVPQPEAEDLHLPLQDLAIDWEEIGAVIRKFAASNPESFSGNESATLTTAGRFRGSNARYGLAAAILHGLLQGLRDAQAIVIIEGERTIPLESLPAFGSGGYYSTPIGARRFLILDGTSGAVIKDGQAPVYPDRPRPPGAVSSGGR